MSALRRRETGSEPVAREARVSNPDPDELTVTIDDFDGDEPARHAWPVVGWPANATAVPARGDRCLVVMSEIGRAWVVAAEWTGTMPDWQNLTPASGWAQDDATTSPVGCAKSADGWVTLRGVVRTTAAITRGQKLLELPRGSWPGTDRSFPASVGTALTGRITVKRTGDVVADVIPSGTVRGDRWTLDGIGYWAED
ncbi:hypothetical protein [Conexibacter sp. CPCC 206217]|uniref:hypothetical protein n=1 Tax=Conexibacter sp. CPCC 206217 TaxID=3064574 RepID=UPI002724C447|nr:hypothetical protein [Conexibacter sp. CPCC 206217]MDO8209291.1 hypothetical protein [Conexibacter sp. CPCC 206217]